MKIQSMTPSKFLKKEDVDPPRLLTIRSFKKENVARDDEPAEHKWVVYFDGEDKGLALNKTNLTRAARALGSDDTDDWIGKQLVLYNDPDIEFGGKLVGGIRVRGPKTQQAAAGEDFPPAKPKIQDFDDESIPF